MSGWVVETCIESWQYCNSDSHDLNDLDKEECACKFLMLGDST